MSTRHCTRLSILCLDVCSIYNTYVYLPIVKIAWYSPIHGAFVINWVWITDYDKWRLFQKSYTNMELFGHTLWGYVTSTRPNDVLYVQSVPGIPRTNLGQQNQRVKLAARFSLILDEARPGRRNTSHKTQCHTLTKYVSLSCFKQSRFYTDQNILLF